MSLTSPTAATAALGSRSWPRVEIGCTTRHTSSRTADAGKTWNSCPMCDNDPHGLEPTGVAFGPLDRGCFVGTLTTAACSSIHVVSRHDRNGPSMGRGPGKWSSEPAGPATDVAVVGSTVAWVSLESCGRHSSAQPHIFVTTMVASSGRAVAASVQVRSVSAHLRRTAPGSSRRVKPGFRKFVVFTSTRPRLAGKSYPCSLEKMGAPGGE